MEQIAEMPVPAAGPASFVSAINEDASDPYVWSAYADSLAADGELAKARDGSCRQPGSESSARSDSGRLL
jgi:hypothetical protein